MQERTCPACGSTFKPATQNQRYCPPTATQRVKAKGQPRSRCSKRAGNHAHRARAGIDTIPLDAPIVQSFTCANCAKVCVPGENVAHHATRFCGKPCKVAWHQPRNGAMVLAGYNARAIERWRDYCTTHTLESYFGRDMRRDEMAYRRVLKHDPCAYCGEPSQALDHIDPRLRGGEDDWTNRTAACHRCNSLKGTLSLLEALPWIPIATEYHALRRRLYVP